MIDNFTLALTHGLMLLAAWRILSRPELDKEKGASTPPAGAPTARPDKGGDRAGA